MLNDEQLHDIQERQTDGLLFVHGCVGIVLTAEERDALVAEVRRLRETLLQPPHFGCPCLYIEPCHSRCTCIMPLSSSGCRRCCSYGSRQQRIAMAEHLAALPRSGAPDAPK